MGARIRSRWWVALAVVACCILCNTACDDSDSGPDDYELDVTSSLIIWANLMPTFPPLPDPIHALVTVEFQNLSEKAVVIDVVRMAVRTAGDGRVLHVFRLQQTTDWDGYLPPGGSGGGEWRKAETLMSGRIVCDESVVGTLWIAAISEDGGRIHLPLTELEPTTLACVY